MAAGDDRERMLTNRRAWDLRTPVHLKSEFYDLDSFKGGRNSLLTLEQEELGDVRGRSLLHLQCHFGMDTLSWARLGARVTGADFSEDAITAARSLAAEVGLKARFICANLYDLPEVLDEEFDIVVTTYGVLSWLPNLDAWARVVAHFLRPGGTFCIVEIHSNWGFIDEVDGKLQIADSVFRSDPWETDTVETYADGAALPPHPEYNWPWTVGGLATALINAGLRIERLRELPLDVRQRVPSMVQSGDGYWHLPGDPLPLMVTCVATRPM
jgi:ubiquinone/menaquinone biosynthesis C-methylase UbiE